MEVVYVDTSVFGGMFDKEFSEFSIQLLNIFKRGRLKMMISDLVIEELKEARKEVMMQPEQVPYKFMISTRHSPKAKMLAEMYIAAGALTIKSKGDALHVATATLQGADVLASWNFRHMVNTGKIELFNKINKEMGYRSIQIKTPRDILNPSL
ncbi:hypothetical protein SIO70_19345 [Chitinophaga sancti]|uniref:hypothetical protein n=1 Tax=Chitinophaga sancti TaxID=1004 RepID=UPI002A766462|nr:hypothetical protein [Chitinophaga sancti]WPQ60507.1 hypothetical protein SIO70_19345 [Chitinophaga sancti]